MLTFLGKNLPGTEIVCQEKECSGGKIESLCIILGYENSASIRESYFVYLPQLRCQVERGGWTINQKLSVGKLQLPNPSQTKLQIRVNVIWKRFSPYCCRRKGPNLFQAGSTILSPRLIDILLNRTFTTYSVHLLSSRALTDLTENRAHQRLFIYNLQIEKISGSFDFDSLNHFVQKNRKMQL